MRSAATSQADLGNPEPALPLRVSGAAASAADGNDEYLRYMDDETAGNDLSSLDNRKRRRERDSKSVAALVGSMATGSDDDDDDKLLLQDARAPRRARRATATKANIDRRVALAEAEEDL